MNLVSSIEGILKESTGERTLFFRNLIREEIQNYVLNFVFSTSKYNELIFTGGTCLRKIYGLNRLSEDLDFDFEGSFDIEGFAEGVKSYFESSIQYASLSYNISNNEKIIYFKLPILKELGVYKNRTPEDIFVRCDFSKETKGGFNTDEHLITAGPFQFFVRSYDLPTLFANKVVAFLERVFYKGKYQKIPFKGRDIYDLFWLTQLSSKSSFELKVSKDRLQKLFDIKDTKLIKKEIINKISLIDNKFLYDELYPLIQSKDILDGFIGSYKEYLNKYIDFVL